MRSCFSALYVFVQLSGAIQMKAAQTLKQPYVLNLSTCTPMALTSVTEGFLLFLFLLFFFFTVPHYITGKYQAVWLTLIHPLTSILVVCIVKHMHTVSQKQIIKLTALTLGKVCEELSNTLMLTLLQSLYLNNSPSS